ncbi:MAG: hypothetical protein EAX96_09435 [Candidatus Lokiarchaeota archaeon]|nr:hypothetical protein [Candidatus Lokiarchaeota archaeon]
MAKTKRFNVLLDKIARKAPKIWKWFWNIGIIVGFIGMCFIVGFLFINLYYLFSPQSNVTNAVVPLIPGLTIGFETFLRILIPIVIVMISHEIAHGIASRVEKVRIKSSGFLVFLILFGAFVEPDEKSLMLKKRPSRMRIYAAGSFNNIVVGFICFILLSNITFLLIPFYSTTPAGVTFQEVDYAGPTYGFLYPGSVITNINGTPINELNDLDIWLNNSIPYEHVNMTAMINPFYTTTNTIKLGLKSIETGRNNVLSNLNMSYLQSYNGTITGEIENISRVDGSYINVTPSTSTNYSRIDLYIDFIPLRIDPNSISSLIIQSNIFLNNTNNITLANYSIFLKSGIKVNLGEFNTTSNSNTISIEFNWFNILNFVNTTDYSIHLSFEVNSTTNNYTLSIDAMNFAVVHTAYIIGLLGIRGVQNYYPPTGPLGFLVALFGPLLYMGLTDVLIWTFVLSIGIAIFNLMPLPPFDGNSMLVDLVDSIFKTPIKTMEELEQEEKKKKERKKSWYKVKKTDITKRNVIIWSVRIFTLVIFLLNVIISVFMIFTGRFDLSLLLP